MSITLWIEYNCVVSWTFFGIAFLWDWNENWPFQSCDHAEFFQFSGILSAALYSKVFRILLSEILSLPLALFTVMFPMVHLTSHSRMSGCMWTTTTSWLSESLGPFCIVHLCAFHLFLISSASVRSLPFLFFIVPIFAWNIPLVSPSPPLEEISSLSHFFFQFALKMAVLSFLAILQNYAFRCVLSFLFSFSFHFSSFHSYL